MDLMQSGATTRRTCKLSALCAGIVFFHSSHLMAASDAVTQAGRITSAGLAQQQDLPSLTGQVAEPALANVPDTLTLNQQCSVPSSGIRTSHRRLAKCWSRPASRCGAGQILSANQCRHEQLQQRLQRKGFSPSFCAVGIKMLYDFGKVSSSVRSAEAGVAQEQASVLVSIDTVAHDTAAALVQVQGYQQLVKIAQIS